MFGPDYSPWSQDRLWRVAPEHQTTCSQQVLPVDRNAFTWCCLLNKVVSDSTIRKIILLCVRHPPSVDVQQAAAWRASKAVTHDGEHAQTELRQPMDTKETPNVHQVWLPSVPASGLTRVYSALLPLLHPSFSIIDTKRKFSVVVTSLRCVIFLARGHEKTQPLSMLTVVYLVGSRYVDIKKSTSGKRYWCNFLCHWLYHLGIPFVLFACKYEVVLFVVLTSRLAFLLCSRTRYVSAWFACLDYFAIFVFSLCHCCLTTEFVSL